MNRYLANLGTWAPFTQRFIQYEFKFNLFPQRPEGRIPLEAHSRLVRVCHVSFRRKQARGHLIQPRPESGGTSGTSRLLDTYQLGLNLGSLEDLGITLQVQ